MYRMIIMRSVPPSKMPLSSNSEVKVRNEPHSSSMRKFRSSSSQPAFKPSLISLTAVGIIEACESFLKPVQVQWSSQVETRFNSVSSRVADGTYFQELFGKSRRVQNVAQNETEHALRLALGQLFEVLNYQPAVLLVQAQQ